MKKIISAVCAAAVMTTTAYAQLNLKTTVDPEKNRISIEVSAPEAHREVTLTVKNADGEPNFLGQGYTNADGKCFFEYLNQGTGGKYDIFALSEEESVTGSYQIIDDQQKAEIVTVWKERKSLSDLKKSIEDNFEKLNLDRTLYDQLSDKNAVYQLYLSDSGNTVTKIDEVIDSFYSYVLCCYFGENKSASEFSRLLADEFYGKYLGAENLPKTSDGKTVLESATEQSRNGAYQLAATESYKTKSSVNHAAGSSYLAYALKNDSVWTNIDQLLKLYADSKLLKIDYTAYAARSDKQDVLKKLMGKSYSGYPAIETAFAEAMKKSDGGGTGSCGGSGSGSGGSGKKSDSGSGISVIAPQPNAETIKNEPKTEQFSDMAGFDWASEAVLTMKKLGVISGVGENLFAPMQQVTRNEVVKMLVCLFDLKVNEESKLQSLTDLDPESWSYPYVLAAYTNEIVSGREDGTFCGNDLITRNEIAVLAYKLVQKYGLQYTTIVGSTYADQTELAPWAKEAISFLKEKCIMKGRSDNTFDGGAYLTRAEAAMVIYNLYNATNFEEATK